ncbi:potassium transporter [Desulfobacula sp.]
METIWIMGVGRFGSLALKQLSKHHKDWQFVLVDPVKEKLLKAKGENIVIEHSHGVRFLMDYLEPDTSVSWIIPTLPVHLAWEWGRMKIGSDRLVQVKLPSTIDSLVPNPMHGSDQSLYVSNADFKCPTNCSEPEELCTVTKQPRKQDMFARLEALQYKEYTPIVLRSRQLAPGIGGYSPDQLFSFLKKVKQHKGPLLLCTACRCHGVITAVNHV